MFVRLMRFGNEADDLPFSSIEQNACDGSDARGGGGLFDSNEAE